MAMFGDLNKLNTKQEKQAKTYPSAAPHVPVNGAQEQTSPEYRVPSTDTPSRRTSNLQEGQGQAEQPLVGTTVQSPSGQQIHQSIGQSVDRSTSQSTGQSTHISSNRIVGRPKAFYITERLDARLDDAVKYLQEKHGIRKVDRSTIVNALLDNEGNWTEESLELLVSRVLSLLTSRLTS
jgi:hypothetical protein